MKKPPESTQTKTITNWDLFKVFVASFFMQAVWNFRSLISIGFSVCLIPVLGKLCSSPEAKKEFLHRHLRFFNAHPYFASFALGVSIRMEEMRANGEPHMPETLDRLKDLLISPLGAVGDRLFWATIKPASLILGMLGILVAPGVLTKVLVLIFTFLLYNIPHFYFRYRGLLEGYRHPMDIYKYVGQQRFDKLRKAYLNIFFFSIIGVIVAYSHHIFHLHPGLIAVFLISALYSLFFNRIVKSFYWVSLATFVFFLAVGILFF